MALTLEQAMARGADEALALAPRGAAWPRDPRSNWARLLAGLATSRARVDVRAGELLRETDPRTAAELLDLWEEALGLPDPCLPAVTTATERRAIVLARIVGSGGATPAQIRAVAEALGVPVTVHERAGTGFACGVGRCGDAVGDGVEDLVWEVRGPASAVRGFACGSARCGDPLQTVGNELLECVVRRLTPAHTGVLFVYADSEVCVLLFLDEAGDAVTIELVDGALVALDEQAQQFLVAVGELGLEVLDEDGEPVVVELECAGPPEAVDGGAPSGGGETILDGGEPSSAFSAEYDGGAP